jgi:LemA protein
MGKALLIVLAVILVVVLVIGGWVSSKYNGLVAARNNVDGQWSQVENLMQSRADKIPNLVATVKGAAGQEKEVFTKIAEARSKLLSAPTPEAKIEADRQLSQAMRDGGLLGTGGRFLSIVEQYPQLKTNENFLRLQDELSGMENRLAVARRDYNQAATAYNTQRQSFPTVLIAGLLNFQDKPLFRADEAARTVPKVSF